MSIEITDEIADIALDAYLQNLDEGRLEAMKTALTAVAPLMQAKVVENGPMFGAARRVLVPQRLGINKDAWEALQFAFGGPGTGDGEEFMDCTAWVGELEQDDGSKIHGLHLSCDECPEEGSITMAEFAAAPEVQS